MTTREELARSGAATVALGGEPSSGELRALHAVLDSYLAAKFSATTSDLRLEARDEAMVRFVSAASTSAVQHDNALAYLTTITNHVMIDLLRRDRIAARRLPLAAEGARDDDAIARFVDTDATAETVERLLSQLARGGDHVATRVLNAFLILAEQSGQPPSYRAVAAEAGVSHTAVAKVFTRVRTSIADRFTNTDPRS